MHRLLSIALALTFFVSYSVPIQAVDKSLAVFYPLPTHAQGKVYAAQSLFLGDEGGLWIHDVHGKVRFFDGQHILPRKGSVLTKEFQQLTYLNNAFWVYTDNGLYRRSSTNKNQRVVRLPSGTQIHKIGSSGDVVWLAGERYFYTYNTKTAQSQTFSLKTLSHFDKSKRVVVNDAEFGISKWILATNSGVFVSEKQGFIHVPRSGNDYVEKLFFSEKRRELLVGTLDGVLVVDLANRDKEPKKLAKSHVLSVAETENEYWIGTENGLFVHSFLTNSTVRLKNHSERSYALKGSKIFSLVNDLQGGIWIATEKGVFYFSLFGQKFTRYLPQDITNDSFSNTLHRLAPLSATEDYLLTTNTGVFRLTLKEGVEKQILHLGNVNDSLQYQQQLWLATNNGLFAYDLSKNHFLDVDLPIFLAHQSVQHLEVDEQGVLWGTSGNTLWSFNLDSQHFVDYGDDWIVDAYLPATVTQLKATRNNGVLIGTEHGVYTVAEQKITFDRSSNEYGQSNHIVEDGRGDVWFASDYGVYKKSSGHNELQPIVLADDSIGAKCLMATPQGIWLASSQGITLYDSKGMVSKHFGSPHGLINNEFLPGVCSYNENPEFPQLLLGSNQGIVKVSSDQLAVSRLPNSPVIISQIKVDNVPVAIGNATEFSLGYGSAVSFLFGELPQTLNSTLEYRLGENSNWLPIEGAQLTLDHLRPGKYTLYLRSIHAKLQHKLVTSLSFRVIEPWYIHPIALTAYMLLTTAFLLMLVWWRSRSMVNANRMLKEQVELKTSQLRHQSKIVLSNNLQLRKQIQVRHTLLEKILSTIEPTLERLSMKAKDEEQTELEQLAIEARRELEQVKNIRTDNDRHSLVHNLTMVLESTLNSWQDEFYQAGMTIELGESWAQGYVELKQFNLDVIFNTLFSEAIKRLHHGQMLSIHCLSQDERIMVTMSDQGTSAKNVAQAMTTTSGFTLNQLSDLVEQSGGDIIVTVTNENNLIQLSWPAAVSISDISLLEGHQPLDKDPDVDALEKEWRNKVEQLVMNQYSNAEFSTASAVRSLYMSERSFQRRFKAVTGKTFKEYLNEVRLEKACERLLSGEKVSQVAFECGFNDPSYFSQRFKHYFGLSPTQFVEENDE